MIISAIIGVFLSVILLVVQIFPSCGDTPVWVGDTFATLISYYEKANVIFPVGTLLICFSFVVVFELSVLTAKLILLIYRMIRG